MMERKTLYPFLNTPAVLIDLNRLEANIREMTQFATEAGVKLRPHIKVHGSVSIAKMQIEAGACGIEVGSVGQAEIAVEQGIYDIVVAQPDYYGGPKGEMLKKLLNQPQCKLILVFDMLEQAEIVSQLALTLDKKIPVLIKVDLGGNPRFGVLPGEPLLKLAREFQQLPGIELKGIYGHEMGAKPTPEGRDEKALEAANIMAENARMLRKEGITADHVTVGSSPTFRSTCRLIKEGKFPEITEIHPGQCVIGDIMYMRAGGNTREACAATVLVTVTSTSRPDLAVINAGYKTFGADSLIAYRDAPGFFWNGRPSFGSVQGRPDLWLGRLSAETGCLYYMDQQKKISFGEQLEIVPNNATIAINIQSQIYGVRNGVVELIL